MKRPIGIEATATIEAADDGAKTFTLQAYNGGTLSVGGYDLPVVVDLATLKKSPEVLANLEHNKGQIVGHVSEVTNNGRTIAMAGVLSYDGPSRERVLASAKAQFPWKASIEVRPGRVDLLAAGKTEQINGQTFRGPVYVAREGTLYGVAFVPRGADSTTQVSIAAAAAMGAETMSFDEFCAAMGLDAAALSEEQKTMAMLAYEGVNKPAVAASHKDQQGDIMPTDKWSVEDIRAAHSDAIDALEAKIAEEEDNAPEGVVKEARKNARKSLGDIKAQAVKEQWAATKYEAKAADVLAAAQIAIVRGSRPASVGIHSSSRDMTPSVIEAALCQRLRLKNVEAAYDDKTLQAAHTQFRGRLGLQQLVIMAAAANGMVIRPGERLHASNIREALEFAMPKRRSADIHAEGFSTLSLPGLLSNVANKELLQGYMEEEQTWREIAAVKSVNDFKQVTSYRMLDDMEYELLPKTGTIKHGTTGEESYTRQVRTYAKMYAITREDLINDDLGAFDDMRDRIGRGAAIKFNKVFWAAFINNSSFFASGNSNYITGATTTLGSTTSDYATGLGLGVKAFRTMTSPTTDGAKRLGGPPPTILLVPPELEALAEQLYQSTNLSNQAAGTANIYANKYRPVVVPFLSDSGYTGYSATAWYLFRSPSTASAPMVVSFLDGMESPTVESSDADFDTLGIQFRGYHDFGCDQFDPRAGIKSKGAA